MAASSRKQLLVVSEGKQACLPPLPPVIQRNGLSDHPQDEGRQQDSSQPAGCPGASSGRAGIRMRLHAGHMLLVCRRGDVAPRRGQFFPSPAVLTSRGSGKDTGHKRRSRGSYSLIGVPEGLSHDPRPWWVVVVKVVTRSRTCVLLPHTLFGVVLATSQHVLGSRFPGTLRASSHNMQRIWGRRSSAGRGRGPRRVLLNAIP
jgi:hypothetical protein